MTDARIRRVPADRVGAREFLDQAQTLLTDAGLGGMSNEGRQVLLHHVAIAACDAILLACGLQVTAGYGTHILRLQHALEQLPGESEDLLDCLDSSRARRVEASYQAGMVPDTSVEEAEAATRELVERAARFIA